MFSTLTESVMYLAVADVLIDAALVLDGDATLKILYVKLVEVRITVCKIANVSCLRYGIGNVWMKYWA